MIKINRMTQKGSLPITGKIEFALTTDQFILFQKGLIRTVQIEAILSFPEKPEISKKKIWFDVERVWSPDQSEQQTVSIDSRGNLEKSTLNGMHQAQIYLIDHILSQSCWSFTGTLVGTKKIPIVVQYYQCLNFGTYCLKPDNIALEDFNPRLN